MVDLTQIINALLALAAAVLTGVVIPWIRSKRTNEQNETLLFWTSAAVAAAEQYFGAGRGEEKKAYVLEWLREKGCTVDDALVEATVNELFGKAAQAFEA